MKAPCLFIVMIAALLLSFGCAKDPSDTPFPVSVGGDFSTPLQLQVDNFVRRKPPMIYVHPQSRAEHKPRALFVPLRMRQQIADPVSFSNTLSRQVWQVWLSQSGFAALEYAPDAGPFEPQRALYIARNMGAEFVVSGYINHYMDGGSGGESSVSLQMDIYDVRSGALIWSLAQAGYMEARQVHDFYLFSIRERNPLDTSGLIVRTLAWDTGDKVMDWADPAQAARNRNSGFGIGSILGGFRKAF